MAVIRWHEQFSIGGAVTPQGNINLLFTEDTGAEANMFPLTPDQARQVIDKLTSVLAESNGLEIPRA